MKKSKKLKVKSKKCGPMILIIFKIMTSLFTFAFLLLPFSCRYPDPGGSLPSSAALPRPTGAGDYAAFVTTSDFGLTGGMAVVALDNRAAWFPNWEWAAEVVSPDAVAAAFADRVYVINRYTYDNISVLDQNMKLVTQYSVAESGCDPSNPQDLEFESSTRAWLSRYECRDLWIIDPGTGQRLGSLDLAAAGFGGSDGIPEMSGMILIGDTLFVAVQLLDRKTWKPEAPGKVVFISVSAEAVTGSVTLFSANPVTDIVYSDSLGALLVGTAGSQRVTGDGGVEAIDPDTGAALGYVVTETELNGTLSDFVVVNASRGYATVTTDDYRSLLVAFDPTTGARLDSVYAADSGFSLWDLAANDRGEVWVCDRSAKAPGLVVFDGPSGTRLTKSLVDTGLPPFALVFLH